MFKFGAIFCILFMLNFCFAKDLNTSIVEKNSTSMLKTLKQMSIPFSGDEYEIENLSKLDDKMLAAVKASLPKQTELYDAIKGDLNKDGIEDVAVVTQETFKDKFLPFSEGCDESTKDDKWCQIVNKNRRGIVILLSNGDKYEAVVTKRDIFESPHEDGGAYDPPELAVEIENSELKFFYRHGKYGYWVYVFALDGKDFKLIKHFSSDNNGPKPEHIVQIDFINHRLEKSANLLYQGNEEYKRYEECIEKYRSFDDAQEKDDYDAILIRKTYELKTQKILLSEVKKVDYIDGRWLDDLQNSKELVKILKIDFWGDEYLGDNADELARCVADKI